MTSKRVSVIARSTALSSTGDQWLRPPNEWPMAKRNEMIEAIRIIRLLVMNSPPRTFLARTMGGLSNFDRGAPLRADLAPLPAREGLGVGARVSAPSPLPERRMASPPSAEPA